MKFKKAHGMKMHAVIGLAVIALLYYLNIMYGWFEIPTGNAFLIQLAAIALIYSNMPDIDQPGSRINKYLTVVLVGGIIFAFLNPLYSTYGIIAAAIVGLLRLIEHRTLIHSVLGAAIVSAPLIYLSIIHFAVGFIAFMSHIVSDNDFSFGWEKDRRLW